MCTFLHELRIYVEFCRKRINCNTVMQTTILDDPWSSITFQSRDPNVLLFTDRCCLHYLDIRVRIKTLLSTAILTVFLFVRLFRIN